MAQQNYTVRIKVKKNGTGKIDLKVEGIQGASCVPIAQTFDDLGVKLDTTPTPEMYAGDTVQADGPQIGLGSKGRADF